jgi:putative FmdB family regulatory protein
MPIYEYRCSACGHEEEFLQKVTDPVLTQCPACGNATFEKQLSAAGFQLKGSGWYATDFKSKPAEKKSEAKSETKTETKAETKSESKPKTAAATD